MVSLSSISTATICSYHANSSCRWPPLSPRPNVASAYGKTRHYKLGHRPTDVAFKRTGERIPTILPAALAVALVEHLNAAPSPFRPRSRRPLDRAQERRGLGVRMSHRRAWNAPCLLRCLRERHPPSRRRSAKSKRIIGSCEAARSRRGTPLDLRTRSASRNSLTLLRCDISPANCFCWHVSAGAPDLATTHECYSNLRVMRQGRPGGEDWISDSIMPPQSCSAGQWRVVSPASLDRIRNEMVMLPRR